MPRRHTAARRRRGGGGGGGFSSRAEEAAFQELFAQLFAEQMRQEQREREKEAPSFLASFRLFEALVALVRALIGQFLFTNGQRGGASGGARGGSNGASFGGAGNGPGDGSAAGGGGGGGGGKASEKQQCPFQTLGIKKEEATAEGIKKAYRKLSLRWHPDKNDDSDESKEMMQKLNQAREQCMKALHDGSGSDDEEDDDDEEGGDANDDSDDVGGPGGDAKRRRKEAKRRQEEEDKMYKAYEKRVKEEQRRMRRERFRCQQAGGAASGSSGSWPGGGTGRKNKGRNRRKKNKATFDMPDGVEVPPDNNKQQQDSDYAGGGGGGAAAAGGTSSFAVCCAASNCDFLQSAEAPETMVMCKVCEIRYCSKKCQKWAWKHDAHQEKCYPQARTRRTAARRRQKEAANNGKGGKGGNADNDDNNDDGDDGDGDEPTWSTQQFVERATLERTDHDIACAIRAGCIQTLASMLQFEYSLVDPIDGEEGGNSPLHVACYYDSSSAVDAILQVAGGAWREVIRARNAAEETPLELLRYVGGDSATIARLEKMMEQADAADERDREDAKLHIDWAPLVLVAATFVVTWQALQQLDPMWPFQDGGAASGGAASGGGATASASSFFSSSSSSSSFATYSSSPYAIFAAALAFATVPATVLSPASAMDCLSGALVVRGALLWSEVERVSTVLAIVVAVFAVHTLLCVCTQRTNTFGFARGFQSSGFEELWKYRWWRAASRAASSEANAVLGLTNFFSAWSQDPERWGLIYSVYVPAAFKWAARFPGGRVAEGLERTGPNAERSIHDHLCKLFLVLALVCWRLVVSLLVPPWLVDPHALFVLSVAIAPKVCDIPRFFKN